MGTIRNTAARKKDKFNIRVKWIDCGKGTDNRKEKKNLLQYNVLDWDGLSDLIFYFRFYSQRDSLYALL